MNTALIEKSNSELATGNPPPNLTNQIDVSGSGNTINGFVDKQIIINNITQPTARTVNNACCNIFVIKGKTFTTGDCFSILKSRTHISGIDAVDITSYPSLFITANDDYTKCSNTSQQFYYGFATRFEDEKHSIKVCYELRSTGPLLQSNLNTAVRNLGISPKKGKDVLGETGWTIHPIDIVQALTDEGFNLTVY